METNFIQVRAIWSEAFRQESCLERKEFRDP